MGNDIDKRIGSEPRIIIEDFTDTQTQTRIEKIDTMIHQQPEKFQAELAKLGGLALHPIEFSERDNRVVHAARAANGLIREFLVNRYDLDISYDPETEESLKQDEEYLRLLEASKETRNIVVKTGVMSSKLLANPNAPSARDAFRMYRFQAYIDHIVAYRRQSTKTADTLQSAG